jgi:hypothetical protein
MGFMKSLLPGDQALPFISVNPAIRPEVRIAQAAAGR